MTSPFTNKQKETPEPLKPTGIHQLQEHVRELYLQQILPALQEVLHEQGKPAARLSDALSMDMDKLAKASSHKELKQLLRQELYMADTNTENPTRTGPHHPTHSCQGLSLLTEYLKKGIIPTYFSPARSFHFTSVLEECYQQNPHETLQELYLNLKIATVRQRFLNLCNVKETFSWINRLAAHLQLSALGLLEEWSSLLQQQVLSTTITSQLQEKLLHDLLTTKPATSAIVLLAGQLLLLRAAEAKKAGLLASHLTKLDPEISLQDRSLLLSSANPLAPIPAMLLAGPQTEAPEAPKLPLESNILVTNAGLVLLHAFLIPYLKNATGLSQEALALEDNRLRAAQLLHYLSTGHSGTPEHQMVFNKVLCGVPLYQPVPAKIILTAKIRRSAYEVLQAVITHWSILKCSSITQLREMYLQHNGFLERSSTGWTLRFEKSITDWLPQQVLMGVQQFSTPLGQQHISVQW